VIAWLKKYWAAIAGVGVAILGALKLLDLRDRGLKKEGAEEERRRQAKAAAGVTEQLTKSDKAIDAGVAKKREGRAAEGERIKAESDDEASSKWKERIHAAQKARERK
jgi:hypothetical protein